MYSAWEMHVMITKGDHISLTAMLESVNRNMIVAIVNAKFKNETLLSTAIKCGHTDIVQLLLKYGADPNQRSFENGRNEPPLITATRCKNLELVKILLENDADMHKTGFYGQDSLFQAVVDNAFDILEYLLENVNSTQFSHDDQNCPIQLAFQYAPQFSCKRKCLLMLIQYGYTCTCFERKHIISTTPCPSITSTTEMNVCLEVLSKKSETIVLVQPLSLSNLTNQAIRFHLLRLNAKDNLSIQTTKLHLPEKLRRALLLKDFPRSRFVTTLNAENVCIYFLF